MRRTLLVVMMLVGLVGSAHANTFWVAVCEPVRTGPPKQPHAEWQGPLRKKYDDAKKDADDHNRQFPDHGARIRKGIVESDDSELF
jgi:hypothetical protein